MYITVKNFEITKSIASYHNHKSIVAFNIRCHNIGIKTETTVSESSSDLAWVTIKIDHRSYQTTQEHVELFSKMAHIALLVDKVWKDTYESGIYTEKQLTEAENNERTD